MTKQACQLLLVWCALLILTACQGKTADIPAPDDDDKLVNLTPEPEVELDLQIEETFISRNSENDSDILSLYTHNTPAVESELIETAEVFSSDVAMIARLDTSSSNGSKPDVSLLVKYGTIYSLNHQTNELRRLKHFSSDICEIIPKEIVASSTVIEGNKEIETFKVMHDESVYVETALNYDSAGCSDSTSRRYYYELPLNYQFNAEIGNDELTRELSVIDESLATAKLVFGWLETEQGGAEYQVSHGYLGYSQTLKELAFFDHNRDLVWSQSREIKKYDESILDIEAMSSLFDVHALESFQYIVQLNQDVFVVDASTEFFAKEQNESDSILSDRVLKMGGEQGSDKEERYLTNIEFYHDNDDLVLIDNGKIFTYDYMENAFSPEDASLEYHLSKGGVIHLDQQLSTKRTFSQYDYQSCPETEEKCIADNDLQDANWQFISDCESDLGCVIELSDPDICETLSEQEVSQSGGLICIPEFYTHLDDLNSSDNDAEFVGFMQYLGDSINHYDISLLNDSLIISTAMTEKDIIVQYFYKQGLSLPKSLREQVLFGAEHDLFGLDHHVSNGNLFINALIPGVERSNECYKNHTRVICDLSAIEAGGSETCTGFDLDEGTCFNSFTEFESTALFCTTEQLNNRQCFDKSIETAGLQVESSSEDGKWIRFLDLSSYKEQYSMYLLKSVSDDTVVLNEGNLASPSLFEVNNSDAVIGQELGVLNDNVETAVGGVIYAKSNEAEPSTDGYLDILSNDSVDGSESLISKFAIVNTLHDENNAVSVYQTRKLIESLIVRQDTTPKVIGSVE